MSVSLDVWLVYRIQQEPCAPHGISVTATTLTGMVQVTTHGSGFGRVGAMLSHQWHNIYQIAHEGAVGSHPQCGRYDYDRLELIASHAAGIR